MAQLIRSQNIQNVVRAFAEIDTRLRLVLDQTTRSIEEEQLPVFAPEAVELLQTGIGRILKQAERMIANHPFHSRFPALAQNRPTDQIGEFLLAPQLFDKITYNGKLPFLITSLTRQ